MKLSTTYQENEKMLAKYANEGVAGGENTSPPFRWEDAPEGTKSFALSIVDHHPIAQEFIHWLVINIPSSASSVEEGASGDGMPAGSKELSTTYGTPEYGGPRPPAGTGDHPYETTIYALNVEELDLAEDSTIDEFLEAIEGKVLAKASLTGMFAQ